MSMASSTEATSEAFVRKVVADFHAAWKFADFCRCLLFLFVLAGVFPVLSGLRLESHGMTS